jgi:DNA-binding transcriptional ArsR family regulator
MDSADAVQALSGLAQETRLAIFRDLVQRGAEGHAAGEIARLFDLPHATLSFHLSRLSQCGLLKSRRDGQRIVYSVDFDGAGHLLGFLPENCCGGDPADCRVPSATSPAGRRVDGRREAV